MSNAPWLERLSNAKTEELDPGLDPDQSFDDSGSRELRQKILESATSRDGMITTTIDPYRQGVEITRQNYRFMTTQPKFWAGNIHHWVDPTVIGNPVDFTKQDGNNVYDDVNVAMSWNPIKHLDDPIDSVINLNDGAQQKFESSIEPFYIPNKKSVVYDPHEYTSGVRQEGGFEIKQYMYQGSPNLVVLEETRQRFNDGANGNKVIVNENILATPPLTTNLEFWGNLDSSDTIIDVSGNIQQLGDSSGNGRHFTQSVDLFRPVYETNIAGFGGKPAMTFTGSSDTTLQYSGFPALSESTIYVVFRTPNPFPSGKGGCLFALGELTVDDGALAILIHPGQAGLLPWYENPAGASSAAADNGSALTDTVYRYSITSQHNINGPNPFSIYVNGFEETNIFASDALSGGTTPTNIATIGNMMGSYVAGGYIATVLVYSTIHTFEEVNRMNRWLQAIYNNGQTVNIDSYFSNELVTPTSLPFHDEIQTNTSENPIIKQLTNPSNDIISALTTFSNLDLDETSEGIFGIRSATAGFEYGTKETPLYGTDSIAFGGLHKGW